MYLDHRVSRHVKFSPKLISYPLIRTGTSAYQWVKNLSFSNIFHTYLCITPAHIKPPHTCAYYGLRNVSFSKNFAYMLNEWSQFMEAEGLDKFVSGTICKHK